MLITKELRGEADVQLYFPKKHQTQRSGSASVRRRGTILICGCADPVSPLVLPRDEYFFWAAFGSTAAFRA